MNEMIIFGIFGIFGIGLIITLLYKFIVPVSEKNGSLYDVEGNLSQDKVIEKANIYYEMGQLSKAISLLEDYIKKSPDDLTIRAVLGDYLIEKHLISKAEKHFNHIVKNDPKDRNALEKLADCYYYEEKNNKAIELYSVILSAFPDNQEVRYKFADSLAKAGKVDNAIKELRKILTKDHFNIEARKKLSSLFYNNGEFKRAISELEEISRIDGRDIELFKRIGHIYLKIGDYVNAAFIYRKIIDIDDSETNIHFDLANIYMKLQNYDKAAKIYNDLIEKGYEVTPEMSYDKVISICRQLIMMHPDFEKASFLIALSYKNLKKYDEAISAYKKLIREASTAEKEEKYKYEISDLLCELGQEVFKRRDYQAALDKYIEAVNYNPKNPEIYYNLGKINHAVKNYEVAISHFNKAL